MGRVLGDRFRGHKDRCVGILRLSRAASFGVTVGCGHDIEGLIVRLYVWPKCLACDASIFPKRL